MNTPDPDVIRKLMMASLDGESTPEEDRQLKKILMDHAEWAEEYNQLKIMKEERKKEPNFRTLKNF